MPADARVLTHPGELPSPGARGATHSPAPLRKHGRAAVHFSAFQRNLIHDMATVVVAAEAPPPASPSSSAAPALATPPTLLESLIAETPRCLLKPFAFFVSWQGVLTLAYK